MICAARQLLPLVLLCSLLAGVGNAADENTLSLNDQEYFAKPGLDVMVFSDFYPEGHQGGVTIVQNGVRVAANGDVRLEPTPGQWQPIPKLDGREVDDVNQVITASLSYPDASRDRKGFNPIVYPDLEFSYKVRVRPDGDSFRIVVDLDKPLPSEWVGRVGFNLELFPGEYFGKSYYMDGQAGTFPRQLNGPMYIDANGLSQCQALAKGRRLSLAPETEALQMTIEALGEAMLELLDGRAQHNNGWFIVRSVLPGDTTAGALEWKVTPNAVDGWRYTPVIHLSQVGYHPTQEKVAVIELDKRDKTFKDIVLYRVDASGGRREVRKSKPADWGEFLRFHYLKFDLSDVRESGVYLIAYGDQESNVFRISTDVYSRHVWQSTLEYFLPVQMCHIRVEDRYRVWHGLCHIDDALMAPINHNHFDGYAQGASTLTKYDPLQPVPGLNVGGWHDAGDYDLRIESQIGTVRILSQIYEAFEVDYDATTIDQQRHLVKMHQPDGVPDVLQQIEHGVLTVLGGYKSLGRLYRGIICPTIPQYVLLGDGSTMTDNKVYDAALAPDEAKGDRSGKRDDRLVFTEENPSRELEVAAGLAAAARALKDYRPALAVECIETAEAIYEADKDAGGRRLAGAKIQALTELFLTTGEQQYKTALVAMQPDIVRTIGNCGWVLGRAIDKIDDPAFSSAVRDAVARLRQQIEQQGAETPFGVPYRPNIWGAGWGIQSFGVPQYFLHQGWPDIFDDKYLLNALNFVLGCHPGPNTASFVSGVGAQSLTVAYGVNRADWSYIPGGVGSGTALIRPDLPELKEWPFFWQQTEYVMGGGGTDFMFLALAADHLLNSK
ncbi:MAG: glycoside hydrolase family 9 protein [Sedimentisphaerales bacterium]|nr:glycoside hydrolase family 9 protein [Sedimentisphaerales bacterium]